MIGIIKHPVTIGERLFREGEVVEVLRETLEPGTHRPLYLVSDITASYRGPLTADYVEVQR